MVIKWPFMSHKISRHFSFKIEKKWKWKHLHFMYGMTVKPINLQSHGAPQNDRLNLIFVKAVYVVCKKVLQMVVKWSFMEFLPV